MWYKIINPSPTPRTGALSDGDVYVCRSVAHMSHL